MLSLEACSSVLLASIWSLAACNWACRLEAWADALLSCFSKTTCCASFASACNASPAGARSGNVAKARRDEEEQQHALGGKGQATDADRLSMKPGTEGQEDQKSKYGAKQAHVRYVWQSQCAALWAIFAKWQSVDSVWLGCYHSMNLGLGKAFAAGLSWSAACCAQADKADWLSAWYAC